MANKEKTYFFIISIPKDNHIEYLTQLNSFILKLFPNKKNPYSIRPMEIRETDTLSRVTIKTTEEQILNFSKNLFGSDFQFLEHNSGDIEIIRKDSLEIFTEYNVTKH